MLSAYIHIPFCRRRCYYCDFPVSVVGDKNPTTGDRINGSNSGTIARYVEFLCQEIRQQPHASIPIQPLNTIFFGGGTPSLLAVDQVEQVLQTLDQCFGIAANAEISMEVDPGTFDQAQIFGYRAAGVNRVSVGVQAFQENLLKAAGRSHTTEDIYRALGYIHAAGFTNISLDLISGLPHQTLEDWETNLEKAIALAPTHLSCYDLTVESVTAFGRQYKPGIKPLPSDETTAEMYRTAHRVLTTAGYSHYEISNYAKPGYPCRHNLVYWGNRPFYGFGMGATSYISGDRFARPRKTGEYYEWVELGARDQGGGERQENGNLDLLLDTLMLGLRLQKGLAIAPLVERFGEAEIARVWQRLQPYCKTGWVAIEPENAIEMAAIERIKLTNPEGFLFSNVVLTDLFEEFEEE
ncbi:coproporphyrinogen III oxidase [Phormidium sp. CLA17]|uniref:radical SAM family heme chaperone HemW n=1 Tax=Leptolyngbya sp. Cla-17 TaxID=2803751 RepID=UPI0014931B0E|nr:radical SAM family heme chaperone HemW [Leptolyngbya sp. Cla-17]MBM0740135.1 coproporphyrinogen III oxidase [Leptolyngbya sp. Cla-17]